MKIIKVGFYKHSESLFGRLIRFKQSLSYKNKYSKYSHVELVFENGLSFSSSERDGGVRFKKIDFNSGHWDLVNVYVTRKEYDRILAFCNRHTGDTYNWIGILVSQMLNFNIRSKKHWFCSEVCARALQEINPIGPFTTAFVNPARLAYLLDKKGFKFFIK